MEALKLCGGEARPLPPCQRKGLRRLDDGRPNKSDAGHQAGDCSTDRSRISYRRVCFHARIGIPVSRVFAAHVAALIGV